MALGAGAHLVAWQAAGAVWAAGVALWSGGRALRQMRLRRTVRRRTRVPVPTLPAQASPPSEPRPTGRQWLQQQTRRLQRLLPPAQWRRLQDQWQLAGFTGSPGPYLLGRWLSGLGGAAVGLGISAAGWGLAGLPWLPPIALGAIGYLLWGAWFRERVRQAQKTLEDQLPMVFDLFAVSLEAGLSFEAAVRRCVPHLPGVAGREWQHVVGDWDRGASRAEGLMALAARTASPELHHFQLWVAQAERTGSGLAVALRVQADRVKQARVQRAREQAALVPVKILFPLVLFIFPAVFVAILGPGLISILHGLAGGGF